MDISNQELGEQCKGIGQLGPAGGRNGNSLVLLRASRTRKAGDKSELSIPPILHFLE